MYKSNPQNADFDDLPFDGDERLITILQINFINDDTIERLNNGLLVEVYTNEI